MDKGKWTGLLVAVFVAVVALGLSSCNDDNVWADGVTEINIPYDREAQFEEEKAQIITDELTYGRLLPTVSKDYPVDFGKFNMIFVQGRLSGGERLNKCLTEEGGDWVLRIELMASLTTNMFDWSVAYLVPKSVTNVYCRIKVLAADPANSAH